MPAALPPVTDCGCSSTETTVESGACCPLSGVGDPNTNAVVPPDITVWATYLQLEDIINGPPTQVWHWNPNLTVWQ